MASNMQLPPAFTADCSARGVLQWINAPKRRGPLLVVPAVLTLLLVNIFTASVVFWPEFFQLQGQSADGSSF